MKGKCFMNSEGDLGGFCGRVLEKVAEGFFLIEPMNGRTGEIFFAVQTIVRVEDMLDWRFANSFHELSM